VLGTGIAQLLHIPGRPCILLTPIVLPSRFRKHR
jgi:hypothetical protein